nr:thioester reductase domain-containing protein [Mycobacterium szulgai]
MAGIFSRVLTLQQVGIDDSFFDLGGDSLSAMRAIAAINAACNTDLTARVFFEAPSVRSLSQRLQSAPSGGSGANRASFAAVHGCEVTEVHARDLTLGKFIDATTLCAGANLPGPRAQARVILLTGATGFLGRYLALEWLTRISLSGGKLICLVRAESNDAARARLDKGFATGDPLLVHHYQGLAAQHLEVIAGDKAEPNLGLNHQTWRRLADTVDTIVDCAALVNHALPYSQLFDPNTFGTAELIRLGVTTKRKRYIYVSTASVGNQIAPAQFTEDADIRLIGSTRVIDDGYGNGYEASKWASEVLLRQANDLGGLPITVFRCGMILADTTYAGLLNLPDTLTRLVLSLLITGIAPGSFYRLDRDGHRQPAHFDGLPVEFVAEAISTLGVQAVDGFQTFHVVNSHDDGIGLDEYVDWLIDAGYPIQRIDDYEDWLNRFSASLSALPDRQRRYSLLPLLPNFQQPARPSAASATPSDRFRAAVLDAKIGPDKDIPHITPPIITKYATDLQLLGFVPGLLA